MINMNNVLSANIIVIINKSRNKKIYLKKKTKP